MKKKPLLKELCTVYHQSATIFIIIIIIIITYNQLFRIFQKVKLNSRNLATPYVAIGNRSNKLQENKFECQQAILLKNGRKCRCSIIKQHL